MELRYVGPHDGVEMRLPDGGRQTVPFNGKFEATGAQAEELLATGDWHRWSDSKTSTQTQKEG